MFELYAEKPEYSSYAESDEVKGVLNHLLSLEGKDYSFSVSFVSPERIRELNRAYRDKDEVTDILTFTLRDSVFPVPEGEDEELGDCFICPERMGENAREFGSSEDEELLRLCIHGFLHLLGLNHETNDFKSEEMLIKQEQILKDYLAQKR